MSVRGPSSHEAIDIVKSLTVPLQKAMKEKEGFRAHYNGHTIYLKDAENLDETGKGISNEILTQAFDKLEDDSKKLLKNPLSRGVCKLSSRTMRLYATGRVKVSGVAGKSFGHKTSAQGKRISHDAGRALGLKKGRAEGHAEGFDRGVASVPGRAQPSFSFGRKMFGASSMGLGAFGTFSAMSVAAPPTAFVAPAALLGLGIDQAFGGKVTSNIGAQLQSWVWPPQ